MQSLQHYFYENDDFQTILQGIQGGLKEQLVAGLSGSARSLFTSSLFKHADKPLLVITHNLFQAQKIYEDLTNLAGDQVLLYPVNELIASELAIASPELKAQRMDVLNQLSGQKESGCCADCGAETIFAAKRRMDKESVSSKARSGS